MVGAMGSEISYLVAGADGCLGRLCFPAGLSVFG